MCLLNAKRIKVEEPLKVYKVLERLGGGNYQTPFRHCKVPGRVVNGEDYFRAEGICLLEDEPFMVDEGYIHCYGDIKDVSNDDFNYYRHRIFTMLNTNFEVFECEVPVGVDCFEGNCENHLGIAASKIRFVRRVGEEELRKCYRNN